MYYYFDDYFTPEPDDWQRVSAVIRFSGCCSTNQFAQRIGLQRAETLYRIQRGQNGISAAMANRIIEHFPSINIGWLRCGVGPMFRPIKEK